MTYLKMITPDNLVWVILGATVVCFTIVVAIIYLVMMLMKRTVPYRMAVEYLSSNAEVQALLGPPLRTGWWVAVQSVSDFSGSGRSSYKFLLKGSVDEATVSLMARKEANVWTVYKLRLRFEPSGKTFDVIS